MNSFNASVECFYNPELRGLPVAVCGSVEERHGIVLAANREAKRFEIKTGDAVWMATSKCKNLNVVPPHYDRYMRHSEAAMEIYWEYSPLVESFGLDEAWIELTGCVRDIEEGRRVADEIRNRIKVELGITASVGVSFTKIFAKLGSDNKIIKRFTEIILYLSLFYIFYTTNMFDSTHYCCP